MEFNKEKFKNLVHYLIFKLKNKSDTILIYNLLYFIDFNYYELYEKSLTNESYKKLSNFIVPIHFKEVIDELILEGKIKYLGSYSSLINQNYKFPTIEQGVIDSVISKLSHMDTNGIIEYSQGDMPWRATEYNKIIEYEYVFYRDPEYVVRVYDDEE